MNYQTLHIELQNRVLYVSLNRPEKHNAFNDIMLNELTDCFKKAGKEEILCIVLKGNGQSFSAGADLQWMKDVAQNTYEQNYQDSLLLSKCFLSIYTCPRPAIAIVHGAALGGANGLITACDLAYCADDAVFSLSEIKIGMIPACISPYIIKRIGEHSARELMLTGRRITGAEAEKIRLVNRSVPKDRLNDTLNDTIKLLRTSGPEAMSQCKQLIHQVTNVLSFDEAYHYTAKMIAGIRASEEVQEGLAAFLEKRKPKWIE